MSYILSIVIPTKNRQYYAEQAVEQIYSITDERVQIVIQDNSDTTQLRTILFEKNYSKRVKYNYTEEIRSSMDNYNKGIELADGDYICCIGDDDGIMPEIVDITNWAKINNIDAVNQSFFAQYWWANSKKNNEKYDDGTLYCKVPTGSIKKLDPQKELIQLIKNPLLLFTNTQIVKLYYGIVKKEVLKKVYYRTGKYCGGLSADIYPATACTLVTNQVYIIDYPFTISGVCNKSTASDSLRGKHVGKLESAPQFVGAKNYKWSKEITKFYSVETIWADSMLHALRDMGREDLIKYFSPNKHAMCCLWRHPEYKLDIIKSYKENGGNYYKLSFAFISLGFKSIITRIKLIKNRNEKTLNISAHGIENIILAQKFISKKILDAGVSINFNIEEGKSGSK